MIGCRKHLLVNVVTNKDGHPIIENTLKHFNKENDYFFTQQVQKILAFREVFGISKTYETSIRIREGPIFSYPISFYEPNIVHHGQQLIVSNMLLDRWFKNINLDKCIKKLLQINKLDDIPDCILKIRNIMELVIERLDRTQISYRDLVISRIMHRVQSYY